MQSHKLSGYLFIASKPVPYPRFGAQILRAGRIGFQFMPQRVDIIPQIMGLFFTGMAPNLFEQLLVGQDLATVTHQRSQ